MIINKDDIPTLPNGWHWDIQIEYKPVESGLSKHYQSFQTNPADMRYSAAITIERNRHWWQPKKGYTFLFVGEAGQSWGETLPIIRSEIVRLVQSFNRVEGK